MFDRYPVVEDSGQKLGKLVYCDYQLSLSNQVNLLRDILLNEGNASRSTPK